VKRRSSAKRIVVLDGGYRSYAREEALLDGLGYSLEVFEGGRHDREAKLEFAAGATGIFIRWTVLDDAAFAKIPSVKYVVRYGVGYDNINLDAACRRGVMVSNVQGYANDSVSDHALALMLACIRNLRSGGQQVLSRFGAPPRDSIMELHEMTVGIVGLGRIGSAFCGKVKPLVNRVIACDPYIPRERFGQVGAEPCPFERLLSESDVVSIHCNLTDETRCMFDVDAFARMHSNAILINTARGPIVDEEALLDALERGNLYGAGVDVFHDNPPLLNRRALLDHPHVVATGHYAWFSTRASRELQRRAAENMAAMLRGEIPVDCLNPDAFR